MNNKQQVIGALKVLLNAYSTVNNPQVHYAVQRAIDIVEAVMSNVTYPSAPAIDWKPINITQMVVHKDYLIMSDSLVAPTVGYVSSNGTIHKLVNGAIIDEPTHYAEYNLPEGVE